MKKILLGTVAIGSLIAAGGTNAADLGVRPAYKAAPIVPPVPVFSWTGCHVGAHVGGGWGRHDVHETFASVTAATGDSIFSAGSGSIDSTGAIFGGQIGCDYQFAGNWVIGIEGSASGANISGVSSDPLDPTDTSEALRVQTNFLGSVTGRLGVTGWLPATLLYVRGGVAWAHETWDLTDSDTNLGTSVAKVTRTGWTVGTGIEWAFLPNWSAFIEYDHYGFGSKRVTGLNSPGSSCEVSGCGYFSTLDAKSRIETIRIGLNYRFNFLGKAPTPIQARY